MAEKKEIKRLTIEDIKNIKNYEGISDEQAQDMIYSIRNFAVLLYEHLNKNKRKEKNDDRRKTDSIKIRTLQ